MGMSSYPGIGTPTGAGLLKQTVVNVLDYGAKGDGTTDDTTALQNALNAGNTLRLPVFMPPTGSSYRVSAPLLPPQGTVLFGVWDGTYGLTPATSPQCSVIARLANMNDHVIKLPDGVNNCYFHDFAIDGNKNNNTIGCGIYIADGAAGQESQTIIENCYIHDNPDSNIYLGHNRRANKVLKSVLNYTTNNDGVTIAGSDNTVMSCVIGSTGRAGICVGTTITQNWAAASSPFAATVTHVIDCDTYGNTVGIAISQSSADTVIMNCGIDRNTKQGVTVYDGTSNAIIGCAFHSNGTLTDNTYAHIDLGTSVTQVIIDGNIFGPLDSGITNIASMAINIGTYGSCQILGGGNSLDSTSTTGGTYTNTTANAPSAFRTSIGGATIQGNGSDVLTLKNTAGTTLTKVTQGGSLVHSGGGAQLSATIAHVIGSATAIANTLLSLINTTIGNVGLIVRGASGQTADLQQWQDSTPAVKASISANGSINSAFVGPVNNSTGGYIAFTPTTPVTVNTNSSAVCPLVSKGSAGQSADLQQWQSSTPTTLTMIDKIGRLRSPNVEAVTAAAGANAGTSPPAPVVTGSTDVRGLITWGTGTGPAAGDMVDVTFPTAWAAAPFVVVTPINAATAALLPYVTAATTTGFSINLQAAPAASQGNTVYGVQYVAVG